MKSQKCFSELFVKPVFKLTAKGNFWYQIENIMTLVKAFLCQFHINFRLAGAGYTIKKDWQSLGNSGLHVRVCLILCLAEDDVLVCAFQLCIDAVCISSDIGQRFLCSFEVF